MFLKQKTELYAVTFLKTSPKAAITKIIKNKRIWVENDSCLLLSYLLIF